MSLGSAEGAHHYILVDWIPKPKKSLSEVKAMRLSKREASNFLFLVRE